MRVATELGFPEPALWRIRPRLAAHSLQLRLRGSSDLSVFEQIFISQEYSCLGDKSTQFGSGFGRERRIQRRVFFERFPAGPCNRGRAR